MKAASGLKEIMGIDPMYSSLPGSHNLIQKVCLIVTMCMLTNLP